MMRNSDDPSLTLETTIVMESTTWPVSNPPTLTPLNRSTAAPPSVKVGSSAVAVTSGSLLAATTLTWTVALSLPRPPASRAIEMERVAVDGSILLFA